MTLVDTSVWVDHLRRGSPRLRRLLEDGEVLGHPFVIGEVACGALANRVEVLDLLGSLPRAVEASHVEALHALQAHRLHGKDLGWVDVHLLASALLSDAGLWTLDAALGREARRCGVG
ncbi:MAG TPA: type II toxin-antitoxin system VapC family toxin [Anaeromyxobacteraceae bacterium]|nr:type II toxin-antitoxin system VapC family toxin [Anaeromyxobacteraceae bacterium]